MTEAMPFEMVNSAPGWQTRETDGMLNSSHDLEENFVKRTEDSGCETKGWSANGPSACVSDISTNNCPIYETNATLKSIGNPSLFVRSPTDPEINVQLQDFNLWSNFSAAQTEMIVTKTGRRMFPGYRVKFSGLNTTAQYCVLMDLVSVDDNRYKFQGGEWRIAGRGEPRIPPKYYLHPHSPATGGQWMKEIVSFHKVKLTNSCGNSSNGNFLIHSMHRYQPRIHVVRTHDVSNIQHEPKSMFAFPQTVFITVTAYQNHQVTKLKIENNPFARGFRNDGGKTKNAQLIQSCFPFDFTGNRMLPSRVPSFQNRGVKRSRETERVGGSQMTTPSTGPLNVQPIGLSDFQTASFTYMQQNQELCLPVGAYHSEYRPAPDIQTFHRKHNAYEQNRQFDLSPNHQESSCDSSTFSNQDFQPIEEGASTQINHYSDFNETETTSGSISPDPLVTLNNINQYEANAVQPTWAFTYEPSVSIPYLQTTTNPSPPCSNDDGYFSTSLSNPDDDLAFLEQCTTSQEYPNLSATTSQNFIDMLLPKHERNVDLDSL